MTETTEAEPADEAGQPEPTIVYRTGGDSASLSSGREAAPRLDASPTVTENDVSRPLSVGVVGCGVISRVYLEALQRFDNLTGVACTDLSPEAARRAAAAHGLEVVPDLDQLLDRSDIDTVLVLTPPVSHAELAAAALQAGHHVYTEKPLATSAVSAQDLVRLARDRGLLLGAAPDTFLGAGLQTARRLIDEGRIGEPLAAVATMVGHGPESWHPDPEFFYRRGAGPLWDMGPYYLTALVHLLGPVRQVSAFGRISLPSRVVTSEPRRGAVIHPEIPTHVSATLEMTSGPLVTLVVSFDVWASSLPRLEVFGSEATLSAPDPNTFGGPVRVLRPGGPIEDIPVEGPYAIQSRGLGLADLAEARRSGRPPRASGELALHVVEVMAAIEQSAETRTSVEIASHPERPAPLRSGLLEGEVA
jgi:predicted dehydrogenase